MCREIVENVLSGTKAGFKATRNLVFNQKAERSTMNRQKSRAIVENVLSGIKACFKSILNYEHPFERQKMDTQKGSSKLSATLLALILGASVFMAGQVWAAKYVTDPSTGKVMVAPQYGGSVAEAITSDPPHTDTWWGSDPSQLVNLFLERMGVVDWSIDRDEWDLISWYTPLSVLRGQLAESYDVVSPTEFVFHIRPGVYWHDKPPMNGRELVAEDIVVSFHRMTGTGSGFAEKSPHAAGDLPIESIEATDKYTVVFKLTKLDFNAFHAIFAQSIGAWIYPPEVIKQYGHMQDWKTSVGTGPYMLTDWVKGSAITLTKNPNYWGYDEKFPENRLPYLDEVKVLIIPDASTRLSAFRTGKIVRLAPPVSEISTDQAEAIQKTNPELLWTTFMVSGYNYAMDVRKPPFDDIRVRTAMQLALDNDTINNHLFGGLGDTTPHGLVGPACLGFYTPFEEWPEEVKANYAYDPERAEALLDAAGYPRGADGIRFKTKLMTAPGIMYWTNMDHALLSQDMWSKIGVDVELDIREWSVVTAHSINAHTYEGMTWGARGIDYNPLLFARLHGHSEGVVNLQGSQDPVYDAMVEAAESAGSREEMMELVKKCDNYLIEKQFHTWTPRRPTFIFWQPWMVGYNGEITMGGNTLLLYLSRVWIDSDLREEMTGTR